MSIYTETFAEWLNGGGELPAEFGTIEGFDDLFTGAYCDKEIGFETPDLFQIKLNTRAALVIPAYAKRISDLQAAVTAAENPTRTEKTTFEEGEYNNKTYEQPINADAGGPTDQTVPSQVFNHSSENDITTREYSGYSPDEIMHRIEYLTSEVKILMRALLEEFADLFMGVYTGNETAKIW